MPGHEPLLRKSVAVGDAANRVTKKLARYKETRRGMVWLLLSAPVLFAILAAVSYIVTGWDEGTRVFTALAAALFLADLFLAWLLWKEAREGDNEVTREIKAGLSAVNDEVRRTGERN